MTDNWMNDPEWYRNHYRDLRHKQRFCDDYWRLIGEFTTVEEALSSKRVKALRFVLYSVYVVQRERKKPWPELETILSAYSFPRSVYASYCSGLYHTDRINAETFLNSLQNIGVDSWGYFEPVSDHWTSMFEKELIALGDGDAV